MVGLTTRSSWLPGPESAVIGTSKGTSSAENRDGEMVFEDHQVTDVVVRVQSARCHGEDYARRAQQLHHSVREKGNTEISIGSAKDTPWSRVSILKSLRISSSLHSADRKLFRRLIHCLTTDIPHRRMTYSNSCDVFLGYVIFSYLYHSLLNENQFPNDYSLPDRKSCLAIVISFVGVKAAFENHDHLPTQCPHMQQSLKWFERNKILMNRS